MSMTSDIQPAMPQSFDRARRISLVIVLLFDIALWVASALFVVVPIILLFFLPNVAAFSANMSRVIAAELAKYSGQFFADLSIGRRLLLTVDFLVAMAPTLFILFHGRRLFAGFARGQVFTEASIAHLKALGFWLIVSAVFGLFVHMFFFAIAATLLPFLYGAMTYVAAYIMAEARRIAADNAEIV
jgi:hypothetical protein